MELPTVLAAGCGGYCSSANGSTSAGSGGGA